MITRFGVKNYKALRDVELPLTPIHVVVGQNDTGKTSLLEAMLALSRTAEMPLAQAFSGEWKGRDLVSEDSPEPLVELMACYQEDGSKPLSKLCYHLLVEFFDQTGRNCRQQREWAETPEAVALTNLNSDKSSVFHRQHLDADRIALRSRIADVMGPAALYRFDPKAMALPATIDPERKFRMDSDGFGLSTLLDDLLGFDPERFLKLRSAFCDYFPQFRSVRIETEKSQKRILHASGRFTANSEDVGKGIHFETKGGTTIRAQQASDGALLFLGLLALVHSPRPPKLLLIEEPEKGVYPKRLAEFIELVKNLERTPSGGMVPQIILTTHSPYLLSFFRPEEVTLLSRLGGDGPVRARPLRDAPLINERLGDDFFLGELWYNLSEEELFQDV